MPSSSSVETRKCGTSMPAALVLDAVAPACPEVTLAEDLCAACRGRASFTWPHRLRKRRHPGATQVATLPAVKETRENTDWYSTVQTTDAPYSLCTAKSGGASARCIRFTNLENATPESETLFRSRVVCQQSALREPTDRNRACWVP